MSRECVWPFCGAEGPYQCANCEREEVMRNDPGPSGSQPVAPPPVEMAGGNHLCALGRFPSWRDCPEHSGNMHKNPGKVDMTDKTCKEKAEKLTIESGGITVQSVPLPEPDLGSIRVGREDICLGHSDEAMRAYGDERERAALARVAELEAKLAEMTRRRDAWKARAPDIQEFNALREAVRKGINDAGDRDLSRVFLRGALVERNKTIAELEAKLAEAERLLSKTCQWPACNCPQSMATGRLHCERQPIHVIEPSMQNAAIAAGGGDG